MGRRGWLAELLYLEQQRQKAQQQAAKQEWRLLQQRIRQEEQQRRKTERLKVQVQGERRRLAQLERDAEAARLTGAVNRQVEDLDNLLRWALRTRLHVDFASLKRTPDAPPFEPGDLGQPLPAPLWKQFAPPVPSPLDRLFHPAQHEQDWQAARERFRHAQAAHQQAEAERQRDLAAAVQEYQQRLAALREEAARYNAEIDAFQHRLGSGDPEAIAEYIRLLLASSRYPPGFPQQCRVAYQPQARQLTVEYQLPRSDVIPEVREFKYVKGRDAIDAKPRPTREIQQRYESVVSQVALRTLHEVFSVEPAELVDTVIFNGHVPTKDPATGKPLYPCILSVGATRQEFAELILEDVNSRECLRYLNALVSPHPYDLEPVRPVVEFDRTKYKFVDEIDAIAGLDGRLDLLALTPVEFEHLVRQLFEAIGMQSWVTQASRDDGVDAVAVNPDPVVGGECIIQAKRYSIVVSTEAVRALYGTLVDKRATKGIMVTTSWYGKTSRDYAARNPQIQLIDGENLKELIKRYLGLDILIGIPERARKAKTQV
jgi:restriction system protein